MPLAVIGADAIGRMHIERCLRHDAVSLAAIADPTPAARDLGAELGVPCFADYRVARQGAGRRRDRRPAECDARRCRYRVHRADIASASSASPLFDRANVSE